MVTPRGRMGAVLPGSRYMISHAARDWRHRLAGADQSRMETQTIAHFIV